MSDVNRAYWDAMAEVHGEGADAYYDVEALAAGTRGLLRAEEEALALALAVGDVAGKDVLHLQCHLGFDAVTLAQRGASVVGADFSPAALEKARALAARCGVEVEYVDAGPQHFDEDGSYADRDAKLAATRTVQHAHSLGEVVTAALGAGLRVEALRERLSVELDPRRDVLTREDDGLYRLRLAGTALPVLYTLVAAKP